MPSVMASGDAPTVSVVIPTYNRASLLVQCLASIEELAYPAHLFELIVIDDGSTDTTPEVLAQFAGETSLNVSCVSQENRGPAAARNAGISQAQGSLVAFTDDDCTVDPRWLDALGESISRDDRIGGVGGAIETRSKGWISDYMAFHNVVASNLSGEGVRPFLITANACYRRSVLTQVNGFDEHISHPGGEDPDLSWRVGNLGYSLTLSPEAVVYHHHKTNLIGFVRSFYHYGRGYRYVAAKHGLPGRKGSLYRDICENLSPRVTAFRTKRYALSYRLGFGKGITFALLDRMRELAWSWGYWSLSTHQPHFPRAAL